MNGGKVAVVKETLLMFCNVANQFHCCCCLTRSVQLCGKSTRLHNKRQEKFGKLCKRAPLGQFVAQSAKQELTRTRVNDERQEKSGK